MLLQQAKARRTNDITNHSKLAFWEGGFYGG
jgi:hypothetical protein